MASRHRLALAPGVLRSSVVPGSLGFATTAELQDFTGVVGQPRAEAAMDFGTGMRRAGYHLFVLGEEGTGRHSLAFRLLNERVAGQPRPQDICYVHNFDQADRPRLLRLPAGRGRQLRTDLERLGEDLRSAIASAIEGDEYQKQRTAIEREFAERPERRMQELEAEAAKSGLRVMQSPQGLTFAPLRGDDVLTEAEFHALPEEERERYQKALKALEERVAETLRMLPRWARERRRQLTDLRRTTVARVAEQLVADVRQRYRDLPQVLEHLDAVQRDVSESSQQGPTPEGLPPGMAELFARQDGPEFRRYHVNVLVDHHDSARPPVVYETHATYEHLVGRVEHRTQFGVLVTDFSLIKPGAFHQANGGFLLLDAHKVLQAPYAWEALKRTLLTRRVRVEPLSRALGFTTTVSLDPEEMPLDVQVVLIGEPMIYYLLYAFDPEFRELFKIAADFDDQLSAEGEERDRYVRLLASSARREGLKPLDAGGMARVLDESIRIAGDQRKLSALLGRMMDLLREADHCAGRSGSDLVRAEHVEEAVAAQIRRGDRLRERTLERIARGTIAIDTTGSRAGQVNALSVIDLGTLTFGRPSRVTARTRVGEGSLVDIEREVELGGPIHSKGVLILAGYLGARYAPHRPLSLAATLVFEQSYAGVEGDSASLAELLALLSSIAEIPLGQSIAVTGSVSQHGDVQAVGQINEKIEGFFDVCRERGLDGSHGVIIPAANREHLMLRSEVVEAVAAGQFDVWAVQRVDEAVALLTGMPAGERGEDGRYPEDSFNGRVEARLLELADIRRAFGAEVKRGE